MFSLASTSGGQPTGFDAGLTQLLARYILGEGGEEKVDYVDTTVETRETMVQNGTVDCVIATYSINPVRSSGPEIESLSSARTWIAVPER